MDDLLRCVPLLEYDPDPQAVLMPGHSKLNLHIPEKAVFAFLGEAVDQFAQKQGAVVEGVFDSITKKYPIYVIQYCGQRICLVQAPAGAPAAVQILDWLIDYGARKIISAGSCGSLESLPENMFLIPRRALRDEGTSYHYVRPSRWMDIDPEARTAIERALQLRGHSFLTVDTWTTDGFFRETCEKVRHRKEEGCSVVEMECSALAACAKLRGAVWGELLYTADTLADMERYDERSWGSASVEEALRICLDAAALL